MEGFAAVYGLFARARNPQTQQMIRVSGFGAFALGGLVGCHQIDDQAARGAERSALARRAGCSTAAAPTGVISPGAVERALAQFEAEQAVALERPGSDSSPVLRAEKPKRA